MYNTESGKAIYNDVSRTCTVQSPFCRRNPIAAASEVPGSFDEFDTPISTHLWLTYLLCLCVLVLEYVLLYVTYQVGYCPVTESYYACNNHGIVNYALTALFLLAPIQFPIRLSIDTFILIFRCCCF